MKAFFTCEQKLGNTIFTFSQKAKVLSTSPLNGGITRHLSHVVNINCMNGSYECKMLGDTYEKDLAAHVHALGLSPSCTTALSTAAWTELRAIEEVCFQDLTVTAVVTGGIDSNGVCIPAILLLTMKRTEIMKCFLLEQSIFFCSLIRI